MRQADLLEVIRCPHVSEKSTELADKNRAIAFKVATSSTKPQIKRAVESIFNVKVDNVNVLNVKGKVRGAGKLKGRRKDWKKAYVTLAQGHDIDFTEL